MKLGNEKIISGPFFTAIPSPPTAPTASDETPDQATVTWQSGGGFAADNFTLYYRAKTTIEWTVLKGIKDRTVTLQGLKTYTTYLCRVFAVNGAGISRPSPLSEFTTAEKGFYFFFYFINNMNMKVIQWVKQYKKAVS